MLKAFLKACKTSLGTKIFYAELLQFVCLQITNLCGRIGKRTAEERYEMSKREEVGAFSERERENWGCLGR